MSAYRSPAPPDPDEPQPSAFDRLRSVLAERLRRSELRHCRGCPEAAVGGCHRCRFRDEDNPIEERSDP